MEIIFIGVKRKLEQRRILHDVVRAHGTLSRISELYNWPGTVNDVNNTVRHATS